MSCLICRRSTPGQAVPIWTYHTELSLLWLDAMLAAGMKKKDFTFYDSPFRYCPKHYPDWSVEVANAASSL